MSKMMKKWSNGKLVNRKPTDLDSNRVRFNWGYHDGAHRQENPKYFRFPFLVEEIEARHFDPIFAKGFVMGVADAAAGKYARNSEAAWQASGLTDGFTNHRTQA